VPDVICLRVQCLSSSKSPPCQFPDQAMMLTAACLYQHLVVHSGKLSLSTHSVVFLADPRARATIH